MDWIEKTLSKLCKLYGLIWFQILRRPRLRSCQKAASRHSTRIKGTCHVQTQVPRCQIRWHQGGDTRYEDARNPEEVRNQTSSGCVTKLFSHDKTSLFTSPGSNPTAFCYLRQGHGTVCELVFKCCTLRLIIQPGPPKPF